MGGGNEVTQSTLNEDWLKGRTWDLFRNGKLIETAADLLWSLNVDDADPKRQETALRKAMRLPSWKSAPHELKTDVDYLLHSLAKAEWNPDDHPRGEGGRFGEGDGAGIKDFEGGGFHNKFASTAAENAFKDIASGKLKVISETHEGRTSHIVTPKGTLHLERFDKNGWGGWFERKGQQTEPGTDRVVFQGVGKSGLNGVEERALTAYKGGAYLDINQTLRKGEIRGGVNTPSDAYDQSKAYEYIQQIDSMMARSTLPEETTVYRGMGSVSVAKLQPGDTFTDKGFSSSSRDIGVAGRFAGRGGAVLALTLPAGTRGIEYAGGKLGKTEQEILIDRNTQYEITHVGPDGVIHARAVVR